MRASRVSTIATVALTAALLIPTAGAAPASAVDAAQLYAAPTGSGTDCSPAAPCSLNQAQLTARTRTEGMTGDVVVTLRGGRYPLTRTWTLTPADSGTGGHAVVYRAASGERPVLSGGIEVTGAWTLEDAAKGVYSTSAPSTVDTRELYVDGDRAVRARGSARPAGFSLNSTGFTVPGSGTYAGMGSWRNLEAVEVVGRRLWREFRCPVAAVAAGSLTFKGNCWGNARLHGYADFDTVEWVENAYELLDEPGEWYLDRAVQKLYYKPRAGQSMTGSVPPRVVIPTLQTLLDVSGSPSAPVHDVRIEGLTFAEATWTGPNGDDGYVPLQSGFALLGRQTVSSNSAVTKSPAHVQLRGAARVRLERNVFTRLGSYALSIAGGSHDDDVVGNLFEETSGGGIEIGDVTDADANPADDAAQNRDITVADNVLRHTSLEYADQAAIFAGYTRGLQVTHNRVSHVPYTGISVGWGWGASSYARDNTITANRVDHAVEALNDGAAIYTLSPQPGSRITGNFLENYQSDFGAIYLDNGTSGYTVDSNVVRDTGTKNWVVAQNFAPVAHDNVIRDNFSDTAARGDCSACNGNTFTGNVEGGSLPAAALDVIAAAGPRAPYANIWQPRTVVDDADGAVSYGGSWDTGSIPLDQASTVHYSSTPSSSASHTFSGTGIAWYSQRRNDLGLADVYLDGALDAVVDQYDVKDIRSVRVYHRTGLAPGSHTVEVRVRGAGQPASSNDYVSVDAFEVETADGASDPRAVTTTVDDGRLEYGGGYWYTDPSSPADHLATIHYSRDAGAWSAYSFTGRAVAWYGVTRGDHGKAAVYLDGASTPAAVVDCYDAATPGDEGRQRLLYSMSWPSSGTHTIRIEVLGEHAAASSDSWVEVDRLDISS